MSTETGTIRKLWTYFKKGKAEIWFLLSLYNTIQLWSIRGQKPELGISIILLLSIVSIGVGYYIIKNVETTNPFVNPYTQDSLISTISLQNGLIELAKGNNEKAIEYFLEAKRLRDKWIDK